MPRTQTTQYVSRRRPQPTTHRRTYGRNSNVAMFQYSEKMGPVTRFVTLAVLVAVLGISFLSNSAKPTSYGTEIQKADSKISQLEVKKADLEVENARLTALSTIENSEVAKTLTTPKNIDHAE